jgi:hypothetical protein
MGRIGQYIFNPSLNSKNYGYARDPISFTLPNTSKKHGVRTISLRLAARRRERPLQFSLIADAFSHLILFTVSASRCNIDPCSMRGTRDCGAIFRFNSKSRTR